MSEVWAIIVSVILVMITVSWIDSKRKERKRKKEIARSGVPVADARIESGRLYNIRLSDGQRLMAVQILGRHDRDSHELHLGNWETTLVLALSDGRRAFVRRDSIRYVEEARQDAV